MSRWSHCINYCSCFNGRCSGSSYSGSIFANFGLVTNKKENCKFNNFGCWWHRSKFKCSTFFSVVPVGLFKCMSSFLFFHYCLGRASIWNFGAKSTDMPIWHVACGVLFLWHFLYLLVCSFCKCTPF